ncbi:MAG: flagellar protein FliS [Magnetospirillum sp.]|nr:flagellar protein FliS [Magnetospirillum sp.]
MSRTNEITLENVKPLEAVVMLHDGVLVRIADAAKAAAEGDFEGQFAQVMRANQILSGLNRCLDMDAGGDVAARLRDTYEALAGALTGTLGKNDSVAYQKIGKAVWDSREAWASIAGVDGLAP